MDQRAHAIDELEALLRDCSSIVESGASSDFEAIVTYAAGAIRLADFVAPEVALTRLDLAATMLKHWSEADPELRASVTLPRVRLRARGGRVDEALSILLEELPVCGTARRVGPILRAELASLERDKGDFRGALASLDLAEAALLDRALVDPIDLHSTTRCEIAGERGQVFLDLGRADLAAPMFDLERRLADASQPPETRFASILHRIHLALAREDDRSALKLIDSTKADAAGDQGLAALGIGAIAALDVRAAQASARAAIDDRQRLPEARRRAEVAIQWVERGDVLTAEDRILARFAAARVAILANEIASARGHLDAARGLLDAAGQASMGTLEAQRCALAADLERHDPSTGKGDRLHTATVGLRTAVKEVLSEWDAAPRIPAGLGFFHFASRCELIVEAIRAEAELNEGGGGDERALDLVFAIDARSRLGGGVPASLEDLRSAVLEPGEVLLAWLPSPESTQLFVVTHDRVSRFDRAGISRLRDAAAALDDALDSGQDDRDAGRALFELLVPSEVVPVLEASRFVTVCGLESFGAPAIEAARLPSGEMFGAKKALCRVPSLSWLVRRARATEPKRGRDLLLVAAPTPPPSHDPHDSHDSGDPVFAPLSAADARVTEFSDLYGDALVLDGDGATLDGLRAALSIPPVTLQFFTHGFLDPSDPRPARLVLAPSGGHPAFALTCDIAETLPAADLVVLAACRSGVGPLRRGDAGAADLSGAFLLGGARAVVSAGSDVRAGPTAALLLTMHERMRLQDSPSEALARARSWLLDDCDSFDAQERRRVAARFRLDGLGHRPLTFRSSVREREPHRSWTTVTVLSSGAVLLAVGWTLRTRRRRRSS